MRSRTEWLKRIATFITVEREWAYQKRLESRSMMNEALLQQYEVEIDWPTAATKDPGEAR